MLKKVLSIALLSLAFSANAKHCHDDAHDIYGAAGILGDLHLVKSYLAKGVSIESKSFYSRSTPIIFAAYWNRRDIVKEFIKRGANLNAQDKDGWTALMYATKWNNHKIVTDLLAAGANPHLAAHDGTTALMTSTYILWGSNRAARALINARVNVNAQKGSGKTALIYAARYHHYDTANDLIKAGANPNLADNDGWTTLMYAADHGSAKIVKPLLAAGAHAHAKNNDGETALELAMKSLKRNREDTYSSEDKLDRKDLEEICKILRAHNVALESAKKGLENSKFNASHKNTAALKRRTTRWARWKANVLKFFKRS
jgi:ankyrin repeat protein